MKFVMPVYIRMEKHMLIQKKLEWVIVDTITYQENWHSYWDYMIFDI